MAATTRKNLTTTNHLLSEMGIEIPEPRTWNEPYGDKPGEMGWDELPDAPSVIQGFLPLMPIREKNSHDLGSILVGTEKRFHDQHRDEIREREGRHWSAPTPMPSLPAIEMGRLTAERLEAGKVACEVAAGIVPTDVHEHELSSHEQRVITEMVDECRNDDLTRREKRDRDPRCEKMGELFITERDAAFQEQTDKIRAGYIRQHGLMKPMDGPIAIDVEVIVPSARDKATGNWSAITDGSKSLFQQFDVDNVLKSIMDAMDFRTRHVQRVGGERPKLGLIADDSIVRLANVSKRERRDGEQCGFRYKLHSYSRAGSLNDSIADAAIGRKRRLWAARSANASNDAWQEHVADGLTGLQQIELRLATLATDRTPLDPEVVRLWHAVRGRFGDEAATKVALDLQSEVNYRRAIIEDPEPLFLEACDIADGLLGDDLLDVGSARLCDLRR